MPPYDILGWQVGVTYGSGRPRGLDLGYFVALLDEMAANGMNLLSLMMQSYGYFDPAHDGYAWPVRHPSLASYRDASALNADPHHEFISKVIDSAADRGIGIEFVLNWGIWNPAKIIAGYPTATLQQDRQGHARGWLHCPDSPGAWQAGLDEVADLLRFYDHPNVKRFAFERVGYEGKQQCFCAHTQAVFNAQTGQDLRSVPEGTIQAWKRQRVGELLQTYVAHVKQTHPGIRVGIHTLGNPAWGHYPTDLPKLGLEYVLPHTIHYKISRRQLYTQLDCLAPNPCVLHFCARDAAPANYPIWIKTPAIIRKVLDWACRYSKRHLAGILFFNEPMVSRQNKQAIYDKIRDLRASS